MSATDTMRSIEHLLRKHEQKPVVAVPPAVKRMIGPPAPPEPAVEPKPAPEPKAVKEVKHIAKPVPQTVFELEPVALVAWAKALEKMEGMNAALWAFEQAEAFVKVRRVYEKDRTRIPAE